MTSTAVASYQPVPAEPAPRPVGAADGLPVFASDGADGLDQAAAAGLLAELAMHRRAETPLSVGIFGPPGSGKTRFLATLLDAAARLGAAAGAAAGTTPFLSRVVTARAEAVPGRNAVSLLVDAVLSSLAEAHPAFAETAVHAGSDPREAARLAGERVNALRRALDGERQTLDELSSRRARLTDAVLFDASGSRLDGFARANRGRIEARLAGFGIGSGDPVRTYKELVRQGAEAGGGSRLGLTLRALWAYEGQGRLLVLAALLVALGWAAGAGADNPDAVASWLAGFGDRFTAATDWGRAHLDLLQPVSRIAFALAALALLADVVRAARFLGPIFKGAALLKGDLAARRRDLDGLLAHQTRRVDGLAAEAEAAGHGAEAAQRRAEERRGGGGLSDHGAALAGELFGLARTPEIAADGFFAELSRGMAAGAEGAPERVVMALDGLDRLPAAEAAALLGAAGRLLARPGFALVTALDRDAAAEALGETDPAGAASRLDRAVGVSYDLRAAGPDVSALAGRLLDPRVAEERAAPAVDGTRSALDRAHEPYEAELVSRLAPFAGSTPRAVKRFVNAYRVARADPRLARAAPACFAMLALGLALDGAGAGSELAGFDADVARGRVTVDPASEFGRAFAAAIGTVGQEAAAADLRRGLAVARSYGRRG
ncbi:P-loop NTPase fold protein [Lichenibacterium dinghuense]|uniref:P-loop NTPase fold protein n=1 Tax=Lichenibacterium dinghuense TaxID=2895977 RepID=UPI001F38621C|nr:P-loop NTPase fold protein [Lichenibacterium sp. 6Y81]